MVRDIKDEVDKLKEFLLRNDPIWIEGIDFLALNYGDEFHDYTPAGCDSVISGESGSAIINRRTGKRRFTEPYIRIAEASHIPELERIKVNLIFDEVRREIEKR